MLKIYPNNDWTSPSYNQDSGISTAWSTGTDDKGSTYFIRHQIDWNNEKENYMAYVPINEKKALAIWKEDHNMNYIDTFQSCFCELVNCKRKWN